MRYRVIMKARLTELRVNLLSWHIVPHLSKPRRIAAGGGYRCARCGSRSARVQRKGARQADSLRRRYA